MNELVLLVYSVLVNVLAIWLRNPLGYS